MGKILVVDDEQSMREFLSICLRRAGHHVEVANSGEAAIAKVACPLLFVLGRNDAMTQPKQAQLLIDKAPGAKVVTVQAGHQMMTEAPDAVLFALLDFLACVKTAPDTDAPGPSKAA